MSDFRGTLKAAGERSPFDAEYPRSDLKGRTVRAGAATIIGQGGLFLIRTVSAVVLARLLLPADFGLVAMATAFTGFAALFKDLGLSIATVQKPEITHAQITALFWINVGISLVVALITVLLAPAIAYFYGDPRLTMICAAISLVFLLGGVTVQHQALLQRQMRFSALASLQVVAQLLATASAIIAALLGVGYWALVVMQIAPGLAVALGVWFLCDWRPGAPARAAGIRSMLAFGANLTGFNILNYFARNLDNVLIGKVWGPAALGFYAKAYALLMLPINQITAPIASVAIPALSRLQTDPDEYARYFYRSINIIAFLAMPMIMVLAAFSQEIILIVLGDQWREAAPIFEVLAFAALLQPVTNPTGWVYMSLGQADRMLYWSLFAVPVTILSFFIGLPWGALGVAVAYTITSLTALVFPSLWWAFRAAPLSIRGWLRAVQCPFIISLSMYLVIEFLRSFIFARASYRTDLLAAGAALTLFLLMVATWKKARLEIWEAYRLLRHLRPNAALK